MPGRSRFIITRLLTASAWWDAAHPISLAQATLGAHAAAFHTFVTGRAAHAAATHATGCAAAVASAADACSASSSAGAD
ncbi:MAG: hypothetical protein WDN46_15790 [Methylocella sp.]